MPCTQSHRLPILIVGGGIGGIATALSLSRRGHAVQVLEQAEELRELGAGIQMPPNAFRAFEALGVLQSVQEVAAYPERLVLGDLLSGETIFQAPIGEEFIKRFGYRYAMLHRGDVLEILVGACRASTLVTINCGSKVTGFRDIGDRVIITTAAGDTFEGRAMVACDGLWSDSRAAWFGPELPQSEGYVVYRGVVPVSQIPPEFYSQSVTMWGGPQMDLFHYPLRRDEILNIGASFRDPRIRVGESYPLCSREDLLHRFRDACTHVKALIEHIDPSRAWVLHDRPPIKEWSKGRVALLGDAAHPTSIYISQGACMALEDAVVLAEFVDKIEDIEEAFRAYTNARYLRTARIQLISRHFGDLYHASGVHRDLRNHILAKTPHQSLYDALGWVFGGTEAHSF
jgi:3-hydroxybenzoate 6-monooxygenase